jgi:hypothetical protein
MDQACDEEAVKTFIEEISDAEERCDYSEINRKSIENRLRWYEDHKDELDLNGTDVRKAYTMVMLEFMKIDPEEVPVVYEDENKIVWRSYNWCPILEACKRMEIDTRKVCRLGEETSVQIMIEKINPRLHFTRNYERIRPYTDFCEEIIYLE